MPTLADAAGPDGAATPRGMSVRATMATEQLAGSGRGGGADGEPSALEIVQFARYLGMDPIDDSAFLWIAEQALVAPLPDDWSEHMDAEDNVFYYNVVTDASSWEHPMDQYYRTLFGKLKSEAAERRRREEALLQREELERLALEEENRRAEERLLQEREDAASLIQRHYRGLAGRRAYSAQIQTVEYRQQEDAARALQAAWRGRQVRAAVQQYRMEVLAVKAEQAAVTIQARRRGSQARKEFRKKKEKAFEDEQERAAMKIQAHRRRQLAKRDVQGLRENRAASRVQAGRRGQLARRNTRGMLQEREKENSAALIQANFRMQRQRRLYQRARLFVNGVTRVQAAYRGKVQRDAFSIAIAAKRENDENHAASKIQAIQRGRMSRRQFNKDKESREQQHAASTIQCKWRHKKKSNGRRSEQEEAAIKIQCAYRGKLARRKSKMESAFQKREAWAARNIQRQWRAHRLRKGQQAADETRAALKIQSSWRGRSGRQSYNAVRSARREQACATHVAACFRGLIGRLAAQRERLLLFSQSITPVVPHKVPQKRRGADEWYGRQSTLDPYEVDNDLGIKPIWLVTDRNDEQTQTANYFFRRAKPLAAIQYLEKSLKLPLIPGARLGLLSSFMNYATLMSRIGRHTEAQRLSVYAMSLLAHYIVEGDNERDPAEGARRKPSKQMEGKDDEPQFATVASTAAVVLHNIAVELFVTAQPPHFGEALGRAGEALTHAQAALGPRHPWRVQIETTYEMIIRVSTDSTLNLNEPLTNQITSDFRKKPLKVPRKKPSEPRASDTSPGRPRQGADDSGSDKNASRTWSSTDFGAVSPSPEPSRKPARQRASPDRQRSRKSPQKSRSTSVPKPRKSASVPKKRTKPAAKPRQQRASPTRQPRSTRSKQPKSRFPDISDAAPSSPPQQSAGGSREERLQAEMERIKAERAKRMGAMGVKLPEQAGRPKPMVAKTPAAMRRAPPARSANVSVGFDEISPVARREPRDVSPSPWADRPRREPPSKGKAPVRSRSEEKRPKRSEKKRSASARAPSSDRRGTRSSSKPKARASNPPKARERRAPPNSTGKVVNRKPPGFGKQSSAAKDVGQRRNAWEAQSRERQQRGPNEAQSRRTPKPQPGARQSSDHKATSGTTPANGSKPMGRQGSKTGAQPRRRAKAAPGLAAAGRLDPFATFPPKGGDVVPESSGLSRSVMHAKAPSSDSGQRSFVGSGAGDGISGWD